MIQVAYALRTPRLLLRPVEPADAPSLAALLDASREHLSRWIGAPPAGLERLLVWLRVARAECDLGRRVQYAVIKHDGTLAGMVQLGASGELGFWLGADEVGHGLATEAVGAVARAAFEIGRVEGLQLRCSAANLACARVAQKLGFTLEDGTWRLPRTRAAVLARPVAAFDVLGRPLLGHAETAIELPPAAIAQWVELRRDLRARFSLVVDRPDGFALDVRFQLAGRQVSQRVRGEVVTALAEGWLVLTADVCAEACTSPAAMLRHNATLAVGAVCLDDTTLILRHTTALTTGDKVARAILLLAHESARLRASVQRAPDPKFFAAFLD